MFNWSHADIVNFITHFLISTLSGSASSGVVFMIARRFISDLSRLVRLAIVVGIFVAIAMFVISKHLIQF